MRPIITLSVLASLLIACTDSGTDADNWLFPIPRNASVAEAHNLLVGQWEWIKTLTADTAGYGNTAESSGRTEQIKFGNDSIASIFRNHTLVDSGRFFILDNPQSTELILSIGDYRPCYFRVDQQHLVADYRVWGAHGPVLLYTRQY